MRICKEHWQMMRDAIEEKGMTSLVAKDSKTAHENIVSELESGKQPPLDPLMSMNWHWMGSAIEQGGFVMMTDNDDGSPRCPVCEHVKHAPGFDAKEAIADVAGQMQIFCFEQGLIPRPN